MSVTPAGRSCNAHSSATATIAPDIGWATSTKVEERLIAALRPRSAYEARRTYLTIHQAIHCE